MDQYEIFKHWWRTMTAPGNTGNQIGSGHIPDRGVSQPMQVVVPWTRGRRVMAGTAGWDSRVLFPVAIIQMMRYCNLNSLLLRWWLQFSHSMFFLSPNKGSFTNYVSSTRVGREFGVKLTFAYGGGRGGSYPSLRKHCRFRSNNELGIPKADFLVKTSLFRIKL